MTRVRRWTDDDGVEWVRRGESVEPRGVEQLLLDPSARDLRFGQQTVAEVAAHDRVTCWRRIEPYVRGKVRRVVGDRRRTTSTARSPSSVTPSGG